MEPVLANPRSSIADRLPVLIAVLAAVLTWFQFLAPIYDGTMAVNDPYALPYFIPSLVVTTIGTLCAFRRSLRGHAAILLIVNGAWTLIAKVDNITYWGWIDTLDLVITVALLVSGVLLARTSDIGLSLRQGKALWPVLAGAAAIVWVIGTWLPWLTYESRSADGKLMAGQVEACCWAFHGTWLENLHQGLVFGLVVVAALLIALVRPASVSGAGLIALAILHLDESVSWLQELATTPVMNRNELSDDIDNLVGTVTSLAAPAGWVTLAALAALIIIGIARARSGPHPVSSDVDTPTP